jgi:acetoacetyl-CoA synthetase
VIADGEPLRRELQAICERVLGVSPIGWPDNLLGFGADSLAVVNLLLEIEDYVGIPCPARPCWPRHPGFSSLSIAFVACAIETLSAGGGNPSGPLHWASGESPVEG